MNAPKQLSEIIGGREAREILQISDAYLYNEIIAKQKIPCRKLASGWIFLKKDVLDFQKKRVKKAKTDKRIQI